MKPSRTYLVAFLLGCLVALALCGCQTTGGNTVTLPKVPAWVAPTDARIYTGAEVGTALVELAPGAIIELSDAKFIAVSHDWLEQAIRWAWEVGGITNLDFYVAESWDCDKFALAFAIPANIAAKRALVQAQPLVARIFVRNVVPFGGIKDGYHALNAFLSDRGLFVYEPQTRTLVPLAQYPNRTMVYRVKIGG